MNRYVPYAGAAAALAVGLLFFIIVKPSFSPKDATVSPVATTTIAVVSPSAHSNTAAIASLVPEKSRATTSIAVAQGPAVTPESAPAAPPVTREQTSTAVTALSVTMASPAELASAAAILRGALVNIICYAKPGSPFHSISASGVIITSSGVILTNAHVAQYFLLKNKGVVCTVRTGSPAADAYVAELEYIPRNWLQANGGVLFEAEPSGTGEYDYALLAITASASSNPLPTSFPHISLSTTAEVAGTPIVIATYGAQFLTTAQVQQNLFPTVVYGSVKAVYTFVAHSIDVLALGGTAAAQEGSSGGGVAIASGELVGTITTSTVTGSTATRELNAISSAYIRADYASTVGEPLDFLLARSPAEAAAAFAPNIPSLEALISSPKN